VRRWDEYLKNRRQSKINLSRMLSANEFRSIYFLAAPFESNRGGSTLRHSVKVQETHTSAAYYKKIAWGEGGQKGTQLPQNPYVNKLLIKLSIYHNDNWRHYPSLCTYFYL
jgi:hypothetical protein